MLYRNIDNKMNNTNSNIQRMFTSNSVCKPCEYLKKGTHCFTQSGKEICVDVPYEGNWSKCCSTGITGEICYVKKCGDSPILF